MTDTRASDTTESTTFPECPGCGKPVVSVTVRGLTEGVASPCGCRLWPGSLERSRRE